MANIAPTRGATTSQAALIATALQSTDTITRTIITRYGTTAQRVAVTPQAGELMIDTDLNAIYRGDGSTAGGVSVTPNFNTTGTIEIGPSAGTAILSGDLVRAGYAAAAALTPYGSALSTTNRAKLVLHPGRYNIGGGASGLTIGTEFVDICGLTQNPKDVVLMVDTANSKIITQSANDCRLSNFTIEGEGNNGALMAMTNASGHTSTEHTNLFYTGGATNASSVHSYANFANLGGTYRRCRSTQTRMYGGLTNGWTCNAVFEDCEAYMGSLGSCAANTSDVNFSGRHTRCRLLVGGAAGHITCIDGAIIEYGWYKTTVASQRPFKVTGSVTPGPFFQFNTIIGPAGGSVYAIDRKGTETDGVLVATHNRMGANGVRADSLTNAGGLTAAQAFNIESASVTS
jgi:hypothetical protein